MEGSHWKANAERKVLARETWWSHWREITGRKATGRDVFGRELWQGILLALTRIALGQEDFAGLSVGSPTAATDWKHQGIGRRHMRST